MRRTDAIVVGAGVMGAATAWRLTGSGRSVVLLEQFHVGHDHGSSHGAARVFRFSYDEAEYVLMAMEALPLWRELEEASGQEILSVVGGFDLGPTARLETHSRALGTAGARFEMLTGRDVMARFPSVSIPPADPVLYQPDAGVVSAERAVRAMVDQAVGAGAMLRERARVLGVRLDGDGVEVSTQEEAFWAPVVIVTAGAWARPLVATLGIDLPVTPTRETVAFFPSVSEAPFPILVEWTDGPLYALPSPEQELKTGWHHTGSQTDPDQPGPVDLRVVDRMSSWVGERFPGAAAQHHRAETCLYTNTEDERFILERRGPIVVGSPCSGHGFKFAPLIGERLARMAVGS